VKYSLLDRAAERELGPACQRLASIHRWAWLWACDPTRDGVSG
jgi:hypothetical protein